jgi:hypothetical protein
MQQVVKGKKKSGKKIREYKKKKKKFIYIRIV